MKAPVSSLGVEPPYRTTFKPTQAARFQRLDGNDYLQFFFGLLRRVNKGTHHRDPKSRFETWTDREWLRQSDNLHLFDNVASRIMLQEGQKKRAKKLYNQLDYRRYERYADGGHGMVVVALAACAYIGWKDGLPCHPNSSGFEVRFGEALDAYGISQKRLQSTFGRFKHDIENRQNLKSRPFDDREPDKSDEWHDSWERGI